jgi:beta-glucosidase
MHYANHLHELVASGAVPASVVDAAARRVLATMARFAASTRPAALDDVAGPAHRGLAREVAQRACVLLRNEQVAGSPVLPLDAGRLRRLAVIGRLADRVNTGDVGSSDVRPPDVITPLAGLRAALGGAVVYDDGTDPARASAVAADADAAVVVVGYTSADEGEYLSPAENPELFALFPPLPPDSPEASRLGESLETRAERPQGGDRVTLTLRDVDEALLQAIAAAQPRTVVVLVTGSAVVTERWRSAVPAILVSWYGGMEGGDALADVLLGRVTPSGRLPCAFPVDETDLPAFDRRARHVVYGLLHGQQHLDHVGRPAAFPLGFGLSYTEFAYGRVNATRTDAHVELALEVTNRGELDGIEIVQCYAEAPESAVERPARWLVAFQPVAVAAGATGAVRLRVPHDRLAFWDEASDDFVVEPTRYRFVVAPHAAAEGVVATVDVEPTA